MPSKGVRINIFLSIYGINDLSISINIRCLEIIFKTSCCSSVGPISVCKYLTDRLQWFQI